MCSPIINDTFPPLGQHFNIESTQIFNRWGGIVFQSFSGTAWDGTIKWEKAQEGVYVYLIRYTDTRTGEKKMAGGDVLLIR